jgi:hypothetical protein
VRDSIHDECSAVRAPYCNTFCSVHGIACCIACCFAYCIAYCFPLGIAVPLGEGRARLLESHQLVLLPYFLPYSAECVEGVFSELAPRTHRQFIALN